MWPAVGLVVAGVGRGTGAALAGLYGPCVAAGGGAAVWCGVVWAQKKAAPVGAASLCSFA